MTTSVSFNPMVYLRHAWDATNSVWGKAAIVLFYSFIWIQIIWAIETLIAPKAGWECFYGGVDGQGVGEYAELAVKSFVRQMNLFVIGFLLYADRGGIKVWNTTMVFVVFFFLTLIWMTYLNASEAASDAPDCERAVNSVRVIMWVQIIWAALAMLCAVVDSKVGRATGEETTPLTS